MAAAARALLPASLVTVQQLRDLARLYSIQIAYEDAAGSMRKASRESLLAALRLRIPEGLDLREAQQARESSFWERRLDPVTVVWGRRQPAVDIRLPRRISGGVAGWHLKLEDGSAREGRIDLAAIPARAAHDGYVGKTVTIPEKMPHGYHVLTIEAGGTASETFLVASPSKAQGTQRSWGLLVPLYAVRSAGSWGTGDLGDLQSFREWVNELGGEVVATLPLLAAFEDEPSPYSPVSRLFWNEMYLDLPKLPEWSESLRDETVVAGLQQSRQVDYERVIGAKRRALEVMAARYRPDDDFHRFASGGAYGYAHFRAAKEDRDSAAYHLYVQYRMSQQMSRVAGQARAAGAGLYLDFPLGVNPDGYDAWKYGRAFARGVCVGSPPDPFFTRGQNWCFAPFDPDAVREQRYDYFRACVRHHVSHAGVLRLDHVMALHRLFWIPEGAEPKDGVYVRYREEELYAILVLEARRHGCAVVGEDLGTVPESVPRMMKRHGLRRMYVMQYEIRPEGEEPAGTPAAASVASINTHDMPTFAGFWRGSDIEDRLEQGLLDRTGAAGEERDRERMRQGLTSFLKARGLLKNGSGDTKAVLEALLRFLSGSPAEIVLVNVEDLWLESEPQNVPGVPERSWRQKFRFTLEQMRRDPEITRILRSVNEERRKGGHGRET
ncbi:MAG TPA: 4-alpha-glucanotransferase [Thermoanaerobaculia bacterium]|nr:4-alpha-glucanotransferase [Thermoanaerobaculia bacterium]